MGFSDLPKPFRAKIGPWADRGEVVINAGGHGQVFLLLANGKTFKDNIP